MFVDVFESYRDRVDHLSNDFNENPRLSIPLKYSSQGLVFLMGELTLVSI